MACYRPIAALQVGPGKIRLWPPLGTANLQLPCGKCVGCKTDRATTWAERSRHEASQYPVNSFVTLTYADENLPTEGQLEPEHLQRFIKRLRKLTDRHRNRVSGDRSRGIRFLACGEYGEKYHRPHYHAILYNCGFPDRRRVGKDLWESDTLTELWTEKGKQLGQVRFGDATPAAASYIAQYSLKKQGGAGTVDPNTGVWIPAPFLRMSLRPAIGAGWVDRYKEDLAKGFLTQPTGSGSIKHRIPRYYKERLKKTDPQFVEEMEGRIANHLGQKPSDRNQPDRLAAAEIMQVRLKEMIETRTL